MLYADESVVELRVIRMFQVSVRFLCSRFFDILIRTKS